ncbi:nickel-dependent hydrogenase large subunit [Thioflavicoccus mobilis]|uniref:nickel-dependent hydrogenase large subunit n=1 Tax=Thioflavicoccus mobilis TaxID=80679 RepID=UPI0002D8A91D|nr:nickel-dependent hydrogenase large subunit [Thioflavicoccus mobilis]
MMVENYHALVANIASGDLTSFNPPTFPKGEQMGFGFHEAPRGVLSHWVVIENGKIKNYQAVVPSTWNAGPRNQNDQRGPYEASLIDNPVLDEERPLEVLCTVHSFEPCLACAIHLHDNERRDIVRVRAL